MSFISKIEQKLLNLSDSYIFYKNNYEKLTTLNNNKNETIKALKQENDLLTKKNETDLRNNTHLTDVNEKLIKEHKSLNKDIVRLEEEKKSLLNENIQKDKTQAVYKSNFEKLSLLNENKNETIKTLKEKNELLHTTKHLNKKTNYLKRKKIPLY